MTGTAMSGGRSWSAGGTTLLEREEAVRAALGGTHLPWDVQVADPRVYGCELTWDTVADATVVECRSDPLTGRRAPTELQRTETDTVAVLLVLAGRERVRQGGVAVDLTAGDALLWSSHAPIEFEVVEPVHKLTLLVPADRVAALRPRGGLEAVALPGADPTVRLLTGHVQTLAGVGGDLSPLDGSFAVDVALDLLVKAIEPAGTSAATGPARDLLDRALAIIADGLREPALSPSTVAAQLAISPRYLHMIFAATGETVAAHIRRRRLERIRHDLADPRRDDETVTTIAFRWGFNGSGQLSRAFRAEHAMSPTEFRARARTRRGR